MGRIGITYSDVAKAASSLQQAHKRPTVDAVRSVLGTGSKSTIVPHLRRWRMKQEKGEVRGQSLRDLNFMNTMNDFYRHVQPELEDNLNYLRDELQNLSQENIRLVKKIQLLEGIEQTSQNEKQSLREAYTALEKTRCLQFRSIKNAVEKLTLI